METKQSNNSATPMADAVKIANQRALFSLEWENDTIFKKRELNYKTKAAFQKDLEAGKISKYTTVFIKDSKEIYKNGQYYGAGSSSVVDITDIFNRMLEVVESGTVQQEDYNTLKSYILDNKLLKVNIDGGHMIFDAMYSDSTGIGLQIYGAGGLGNEYILVMKYSISKDLKLTYLQVTAPSFSEVCRATLDEYVKQESYSSITPSDTINKAIGKLEASVGKIVTNGNGTKFLSDNGEYKEVSDTIINIDSIDGYTGKLSGITYSEIVDCIKKNKNIKVRMNMGGMGYIFTPISCVYIERSNLVTISIDTSLMQYANAYTKIVTLTIVNDNSYAISSVDKSVICGDFTNNGDILINLSYKGLSGQEEKSTSVTLKKTGDGTKFLSDNGEYKEVNSYYKLTDKFYQLTNQSTSDDIKNAIGGDSGFESLKSAIKSHTRIFCEFNNGNIEYCGELQCSYSNIQVIGEMIAISMLGYEPFMLVSSAASCAVLVKTNNEYSFLTGIMGKVSQYM